MDRREAVETVCTALSAIDLERDGELEGDLKAVGLTYERIEQAAEIVAGMA
jgi:hypothetical protein